MTVFDFKHPDYDTVFKDRMERLKFLQKHPAELRAIKAYYANDHYDDFINDWGMTFDPRNAEVGQPTMIPFVLFPKQREFVHWLIERWRNREPGLVEKSRDIGISWLSMSLASTLCLFHDGLAIGVGSRKSEYVDKIGEPKSLLWKARFFMEHLPEEFRGSWSAVRDAPHMRVYFPDTGSYLGGEGGDDIGRGDRTAIYLVDEAAHLERPTLVEASLSQTTNCRIDMSSVRGMNNPFAQKRHKGKVKVFVFDWRDDPRKDDAWYRKQCDELDPVVVAQEIDRDYLASVHGVVIPGVWVRAAIGALGKLGIAPTGSKELALDIADEGDKNAVVGGAGVEISVAEEWSGRGSDTFATVERAFEIVDEVGARRLRYDGDGLGALVRGDGRILNDRRVAAKQRPVRLVVFRGSGKVFDPEGTVEGTRGAEGKGRLNKDYYYNAKAQGWWALRKRFQKTYRWVVDGVACNPDDIISLDPKMPNIQKLVFELSQATYSQNNIGKMLINKKPDGLPSPNLADGAMMRYAPIEPPPMNISPSMLTALRAAGGARRR